jgi:pilus assembly protein CpaF
VVPTVASAVDLVVHLGTDQRGQRRLREVVGVTGRTEGDVIETSDLFTTRADGVRRADGYPPHAERYEAAGMDLADLLGNSGYLSGER